MRRYQILFFLISSCLLLSGCAVKTVKGFEQQAPAVTNYPVTYFSDAKTDYVYKAHIAIYGRDFGGIFIAKKINDTLYRAAFTTEFGNKLFDFEITDTSFKVNYILEELDKALIVNTLKRDFMLLLKQNHAVQEQYKDNQNTVYKSDAGKRSNYLFIDKTSGQLAKIVNATKSKEKTIISYTPQSNILAKNIVIEHKNIKLKIELNYLEQ
ncbi:hypothetical protein [Flavobacterium subsaxonicum]|uniref:Lipoprotein n=1 Tax=Flavobacterium subsaxonicum WB 4.1-42 = DSM 21790 TaxID=1121898 RepID=A0A0A2MF42_9FLAO|nr:hypothetical protein [Flavobacterium subsaxonicum]KGO91302.1 hypothetical protein Q766_18670 [Flavobacterium subsaxonicum WB 4.1-42 = DSM 21790]